MTNFDPDGKILLDKAVQLKPYIPREPIMWESMSDDEITQYAGTDLVVDTESYSNYFLIAFKHLLTGKIIIIEPSYTNYNKLSWVMNSYRTIGFNSNKYDIPLIWLAYVKPEPSILKEASNTLIFNNTFPQALQTEYNFKIHKTNHIDLIEVCPLTGSLKLYGARLHSKRIQELPYAHNKELSNDEINVVRDYCVNDLYNTELLFNNLSDQLALRQSLSIQYKQDLMSKSDAQIAEAVICGELKRLTGKWPKRPEKQIGAVHSYKTPAFISFQTEKLQNALKIFQEAKYEVLENGRVPVPLQISELKIPIGNGLYSIGNGGLHSKEKSQYIKADNNYYIFDEDIASNYPRIILNCGIFPQSLGAEFLTVYNSLVERRLEAKKNKNISVAEALKITINGTFGKLGSPYSKLYAPDLMIQVTVTGQLALLMLIEGLEMQGIEVFSANTDGIIIKCHKDQKELMKTVIRLWEYHSGFTTEETEYGAVYSRDVNYYLAVKKDGKSKGKNGCYDPWGSGDPKDLIWRFFKNPNAQICTEALTKLITQNVPIEKTIRECKDITRFVCVKNVTGGAHKDGHYLGKVVRWYYATNTYGTINYVKNNHKVGLTEKAKPLMDLPNEFPDDVAYDIYIQKAVDMGFDLAYFSKEKQVAFF